VTRRAVDSGRLQYDSRLDRMRGADGGTTGQAVGAQRRLRSPAPRAAVRGAVSSFLLYGIQMTVRRSTVPRDRRSRLASSSALGSRASVAGAGNPLPSAGVVSPDGAAAAYGRARGRITVRMRRRRRVRVADGAARRGGRVTAAVCLILCLGSAAAHGSMLGGSGWPSGAALGSVVQLGQISCSSRRACTTIGGMHPTSRSGASDLPLARGRGGRRPSSQRMPSAPAGHIARVASSDSVIASDAHTADPVHVTAGPLSVVNTVSPHGSPTGRAPSGLNSNPLTWDLARDMQTNALSAHPLNPFADAQGNPGVWELMLSSGRSRDPATFSDLNVVTEGDSSEACTKADGARSYPPGVVTWNKGPLRTGPYAQATVNTTHTPVGTPCAPGQVLAPHRVFVHPGPANDAVIAWHSPIRGVVSLRFRVSDADCGGGDGIAWYIERETTQISSGAFGNCGSEMRLSGPISVNRGTTLYFLIDPKADYSNDLTEIDLTIDRLVVPDNRFVIRRVRTRPNGTVRFRVVFPGPGVADVMETAWLDNFARDAVPLQPAPRRFVFARKHLRVRRAGTVRATVKPGPRGRRLIAHHRYAVVIRLWVSYTPTDGTQRNVGLYGLHITYPKHPRGRG
jgi:hypothetical protein